MSKIVKSFRLRAIVKWIGLFALVGSCHSSSSDSLSVVSVEWEFHMERYSRLFAKELVDLSEIQDSKRFFYDLTGIDASYHINYISEPVADRMTRANINVIKAWFQNHKQFLSFNEECLAIEHRYDPSIYIVIESYRPNPSGDKMNLCDKPPYGKLRTERN